MNIYEKNSTYFLGIATRGPGGGGHKKLFDEEINRMRKILWTDSLYQVGEGFQSWVPSEAWLSSQEFTKRILDVSLSEANLAAPAELSSK